MGNPGVEPPPCRLSAEEVNDPYLVLDGLFDYAHLPQVRGFLWDWLRLTVTGGYNRKEGFYSRSSVLIIYDWMEKLVEAAHLLHLRHKVEGEGRKAASLGEDAVQEGVNRIVGLLKPVQVYLLGKVPSTAHFKTPTSTLFLALMPAGGRSMPEYESLVENSQPHLPLSVMVKPLAQVARLRKEGNPFFIKNCVPDRLVYDDGSMQLEEAPGLNEELIGKKAALDREGWLRKSVGFLSGARGFMEMGQNNLAAFMLHQSAEHALTAVLLSSTGYREATHNLHKLLQYTALYAPGIAQAFSFATEKEKILFRQLQKAYTDARYKENYKISKEELDLLLEKISTLLEKAKEG